MYRAKTLSSSGVTREKKKHVTEALQRNRYLANFIHRNTGSQSVQRQLDSSERHVWVTLTYLSGLSESICRVLSQLAIQVNFHPFQTLRQELVHPKDPVPMSRRKGVVYSIPCAECPQTYIGQTGRSLDHRLREHNRALKNGDVTASAIAEHVFLANHQVDLCKATMIDVHPHLQTRCILESWYIQPQQTTLNWGRGTLPELYAALLDWTRPFCFSNYYYHYYGYIPNFRATFLAYCTRMPHVTTSSFVCTVCIYTSLPACVIIHWWRQP